MIEIPSLHSAHTADSAYHAARAFLVRPRVFVNHASRGWIGLECRGVPLVALPVVLLGACLAAVGSTAMAKDGPTIRSVAVGLGGWVKAGKWAPVRVEVDGVGSIGSLGTDRGL
jgi:hypothetical protein